VARIRTIKPEFWSDEKVVELGPWERLLFIALWNFSDDQGYVPCRPRQIKMWVFPGDDHSVRDVGAMLCRLTELGLMDLWTSPEGDLLHSRHWTRHQRINRPSKPRWSQSDLQIHGVLTEDRMGLTEHSLGKGKEGKGVREVLRTSLVGSVNGTSETSGESDVDPEPEPHRADVDRVCTALRDAIVANGSKRPNITKAWRRDTLAILDTDRQPVDTVLGVIRWCQAHQFWRARVMSPGKLRQHWDAMRLDAERARQTAAGGPAGARVATTDAKVAAAQALKDTEGGQTVMPLALDWRQAS